MPPRALTVFCGSSLGSSPSYALAASQVGTAFARAGTTLIYGLMGIVAASTLAAGGRVHGVLPTAFLFPTLPNGPIPSFTASPEDRNVQTSVESMHERKKLMADLSGGFVGLPGGYGTLEEVAEMTTWTQLGIPVILLNVDGFFSPLREFIEGAITASFIQPTARAFLVFVDPPDAELVTDFDWGRAALEAVKEWEKKGAGGGTPYSLEWGTKAPVDMR